MMDGKAFKYDVAFSFLAKDEEFANLINDVLKGRLQTFIYSERQLEIAGTDGEQAFAQVFGSEARIVVVLYRDGWGQTPWTRIEQTAIRNRAYEDGFDFALFIPLDPQPSVPKWLPKTQLWIDLERWGVQGAATIIEDRVRHSGGVIRQFSAVDEAAALAQVISEQKKRRGLLNSIEGVSIANKEAQGLFAELKRLSEEISKHNLAAYCTSSGDECIVYSEGLSLALVWVSYCINSLEDSYLLVRLFKGVVRLRGRNYPSEAPTRVYETKFKFDIDERNYHGWREQSYEKMFYTSAQLADHWMKQLVAQIWSLRPSS